MKKKDIQPSVMLQDGVVSIKRKRRSDSTYLNFCTEVKWDSEKDILKPIDSYQCYIKLSADVREKIKGNYCVVLNPDTGDFVDVLIDPDVITECTGEIFITNYVKRRACITNTSRIVICTENYDEFSKVRIQKMENIKSDYVAVPEGTVSESLLKDFSLFEIINNLTNDTIFVKSKNIVVDNGLPKGTIRLNRKQRKLLSDNIPLRLSDAQWQQLMDTKDVPEHKKELFSNEYRADNEGYTIIESMEDMSYASNQAIQEIIKANFGESIILRPVIDSFRHKDRRGLVTVLSDLYVGRSSLTLNCRRPHECDENADIVRMTEDNMKFLGIEPMDRVILRYKNRHIACHVLPFDESKFTRTNLPGVMELAVGIPAHIRSQLEITDIQTSVKVDRDTAFIFRKSFNEQLVPVLLALFSINIFEKFRIWLASLVIAILIPLIMYFTLSPKRNMRGK